MSTSYTLLVHYGGYFVHVPDFHYAGIGRKMIRKLDLENISVTELHNIVANELGSVIGEYDCFFYSKDHEIVQKGGICLLNEESKEDFLQSTKRVLQFNVKVGCLYVVHLNTPENNSNANNSNEKNEEGSSAVEKKGGRQKHVAKKKSTPKKKQRKDKEIEVEMPTADERNEVGSDSGGEGSCSDEELNEIRKMRTEVRKQQREMDAQEIELIRRRLRDEVNGGENEGPSFSECSESLNSLLEEDTEEEDDDVAYAEPPAHVNKKVRVNEVFNINTPGEKIKFVAGLIFGNKAEVKAAVREYSIASGRPLNYSVDDQHRIQVSCASGCPFKMWVSHVKDFDGWQIKTITDEHNCIYHFSNKLVTVKYLADLYGAKIRRNPNWKLTEMQEEFKKELKVDVAEYKCCRVRQTALSAVHEEMVRHFAGLRKFGGEILRSNRQNTVKIMTTRINEDDEPHFKRFYVCYDALKKAWSEGCRPVLGLDGCFIKNVCGGQLLSAVGRDGNNSIVPVAIAVVESENYETWKWFLELLGEDLHLGFGTGFTLISDQQKGLDNAIMELLPHVEHRYCTRHIYSNLRKKYPSQAVRFAFWNCATATHPEAFKTAMKQLEKVSKGAAERMGEFDPRVWTKAYFATQSKCDSTENNISECFNSWILKARYMPLIEMLTEIHDMIMERLHKKRDAMLETDCILVPRVKKALELAIIDSAECEPKWNGKDQFRIKWRGISYCVSLKDQTCSCRVWDLTGIPCLHVVSAINYSRQNPVDYVANWYTKDQYLKTYSHALEVIRGEPFWEDVQGDNVLPPEVIKRLRGRPKKQRRREGWEGRVSKWSFTRLSRVGRKMHCSFCKGEDHNLSKCPNKPEDYQPEPKEKKKRGRKRKVTTEEVAAEEAREKEATTGEETLMDDLLRTTHTQVQPQSTSTTATITRRSERLSQKSVFMPTPGLLDHVATGGTPPASTPPNPIRSSQLSSTKKKPNQSRLVKTTTEGGKAFKPPRKT